MSQTRYFVEHMQSNASITLARDHGGGVDAAVARWGGARLEWVDLSTGINLSPYPLPTLKPTDWTALPDKIAQDGLLRAARDFWNIPDQADVLAAPGASVLIAALPAIFTGRKVAIEEPTYNEHRAAFEHHGWNIIDTSADVRVLVNPNNPDGQVWRAGDVDHSQVVIDESFADVDPSISLVARAGQPGGLVLKSFGKFWGLAGLRLGFAIGSPDLIADLRGRIGPWAVSGPALHIGASALADVDWARQTRLRLKSDVARLDQLMDARGAKLVGGTSLFRLYDVEDASAFQDHLAQHRIWSRIFPYSKTWLRLGLPGPDHWDQVETALRA